MVQEALANTLRRLPEFAPRRQKALQAYLRQAIRNRIRDELRRHDRRAPLVRIDNLELAAPGSLLDETIERDNLARYQEGLGRLAEPDRELIVARLELGYSYAQMALATGRSSEDAARMALKRALVKLAEEMASA
jgi:RNA polymerase sigma-70 factor (ECF subfamily)